MNFEKNKPYIRKLGKRTTDQKRVYPTLNLPQDTDFEPGDTVELIETEYNGNPAIIITH